MSKHPWQLHIEKKKELSAGFWHTTTLTGASHYGEDYVAVVDADGEVVADNGQYYAQAITIENGRLIAAAPDLLSAQTMGANMNTPDFLEWLAERLVHVYGESSNVDFVLSLKARAAAGRAAIEKATGGQP